MTDTIWQTIAATPWWIYLISAYFLWVGAIATKSRLVSIKSLSTLPLFFVALSVMSMCAMVHTITYTHLSIWTAALFLGTGLGYLQLRIFNIQAVKNTYSLYMPGTWRLLIIFLALLIAQFYFGFQLNIDPQILIDPKHSILLVFLYGLMTGLFAGRLAYGLRCVKSGPFRNQDSIAFT